MKDIETQYLELLQDILDSGTTKKNRTGVDVLVSNPTMIQHDMRNGFPLLTTKQMAKKTMAVELEGFIGGITDKSWYQRRGCKIWNEWCNPTKIPNELTDDERKEFQLNENDLGPIYGSQWRRFNQPYDESLGGDECSVPETIDEAIKIGDQFHEMILTLKTNPNDRRMVISAWNPSQSDQMALPPCHYSFVIQHINGVINLTWTQRSVDVVAGLPFNIASYGLLLELIAKETGMVAGILTGFLIDCHVYENHIEPAKTQLMREPKPLPTISFLQWSGIYDWCHNELVWENYEPHPPIKLVIAV